MRKALVSSAVLLLFLPACRGFQRKDSRETGYANALECVEVKGDTAESAAASCAGRGFSPAVPHYKEGFEAGLACVRSQGAGATEAAAACRAGG